MPPLGAQPLIPLLVAAYGKVLLKSWECQKKCMAESAEDYSLQIVSERFTNLAEKGEIRGQEAFLKVALDYYCYAGLSTDTTQVPRASHFYSWATFKTVIKCSVQRGCFDSWCTLKVLP